jgi:hypothetical protein
MNLINVTKKDIGTKVCTDNAIFIEDPGYTRNDRYSSCVDPKCEQKE